MKEPTVETSERWLTPGVRGIGAASFLADVGHETTTAVLSSLIGAATAVWQVGVLRAGALGRPWLARPGPQRRGEGPSS